MKRIITILLIILIGLSILTSCNMVKTLINPGTEGSSNSSGDKPSRDKENNNKDDDPCPCCSNCIQKECECAKCGDSDDCECKLPDSLENYPPVTYDMTICFELYCECGESHIETFGEAEVTMYYVDDQAGYLGKGEGSGETVKNGMHEFIVKNAVVPGDLPGYEFKVQISMPMDKKVIRVGVNKFGPDESTYDWSAWGSGPNTSPSFMHDLILDYFEDPAPPEYGYIVYPDTATRLMVFEIPLAEGDDMQGQQFKWNDIFITIALTLVE